MSQTPPHRRPVSSRLAIRASLLGPVLLAGCSLGGATDVTGVVGGTSASSPNPSWPAYPDPAVAAGGLTAAPLTRPREPWTPEADYPDLDRTTAVAPPRFSEQRTWPRDPQDPASGRRPPVAEDREDSFAQAASLWGDWGAYYDGPEFGRERFDGGATLTMVTDSEVGYTLSPNVSRDGRRLVFVSDEFGQSSDIFVRRVDGSTKTRITHDAAVDLMPVFSPDGSEIAYSSNREGSFDIYVIPTGGGAPTRLTHHLDDALHPTFSPDGRRVAYCRRSSRTNRWEIWMFDRDTGQEKLLHYGMFPEWNPDPTRSSLVFQQGRERSHRFYGIWTIDLVDGEASAPTEIASAANYACMHPTWSPDGTRIAFTAVPEEALGEGARPSMGDIWIVGADGRERRQLTMTGSFNMQPAWSRDGTIFFTSDRSGMDNIWALRDPDTIMIRDGGERVTAATPGDDADAGAGR